MPYLSRVFLNPLRTGAQRFLRNPQALHAAILGGLSRQPVDERVLWRLEPDGPHRAAVLILTQSTPSWEHLIEQAGWVNADEPQALVRSYQPLLDQVVMGREFAFRLKANPVTSTFTPTAPSAQQKQRLADQPRQRGVRVAHRTAEHQLAWLTTRLPHWGFVLLGDPDGPPTAAVTARERLTFRKRSANGSPGQPVTLTTATFDGLLRVDNPQAARQSLLDGVGPGKAYGLGLITLAAPTTHHREG